MAAEAAQGQRRAASTPAPRSSHTADEFLRDFLSPAFDAAAYLNATLPPLARGPGPGQGQGQGQARDAVPLAELSAQAQTLFTQLDTHTTRLSNTLTQLTDDMLRSGSRLAYEVELLRGETMSLSETLHETLHDDVARFVPGGLPRDGAAAAPPSEQDAEQHAPTPAGPDDSGAECVRQLQTLTLVRERLDAVIKTFGDAMEFTFPPSEVSVSSGFLSVSAPEPGSQQQSSEERGQQVLKELRDEIAHLLRRDSDDAVGGIEAAANRIEELKELATVWKGTAEEKGRTRFIESLAKMVEERHRELVRETEQAAHREGGKAAAAAAQNQQQQQQQQQQDAAAGKRAATADDSRAVPGGLSLIGQLQRLRGGL